MLDLKIRPNQNTAAGSTLVLTFSTNNLLNNLFANDLEGLGTVGSTYRYLDCSEWSGYSQLSSSRILCLLYYGNNLASPPVPANLTIQFSQAFGANNYIRIVIANVLNPSTVGLNVGIKANVNIYC
jgi:hypothetical protein